ncbi:alpha/beta hydrolase fold domain-containing protein [Arthrobacter sp.]|uniref:alpha/beta hydrolase n=1 Tax=Arthrobacter sp. TaxID=1667 RepID=UPI0033959500
MALDTATQEFLGQMARQSPPDAKPMWEMTPGEARAMGAALLGFYGAGPDMEHVEERRLKGEDGGEFTVRILRPKPMTDAVIVYYHGGGWVVGHINEFDTLGRKLAESTGATVVLVDYRLAPEFPFPTPVNDAWSALVWADGHREELTGTTAADLVVAGDSAGGNLAAVVALRSRDRQGPLIDRQVLVYPVTDADLDNGSYSDPENALMLTRQSMVWFWDHYAPLTERNNPEVAPLRAADLSNLPPAIVLTASNDVLRDEGEAYARRLADAGVPVQHRRFDGQMHGFFTMVNVLPGSAEALGYITKQLGRK